MHIISAVALEIFNSRIITTEVDEKKREPTLSDLHSGLLIFRISTIIFEQKADFAAEIESCRIMFILGRPVERTTGELFTFEVVLEMKGGEIKKRELTQK